MKSCFVRTLWGDELIDRYGDRPYEVAECRRRQPQPEPSVFVAFGKANADMARAAGWPDVIQASEDAVVNLTGNQDRNARFWFGQFPYGISMYYHKFLAVAAALRAGWDECVFLDLETVLLKSLPEDFWQILQSGQPLQCPLYCYHRRHAKLPDGSHYHPDPRIVASAPAFYCRDASIMDECLAIASEVPSFTEETVMRIWHDRREGTWRGIDGYVKEGYQFPYHAQRHGMLVAPMVALFDNANLKGYSQMRRKGVKYWEEYVDCKEATADA